MKLLSQFFACTAFALSVNGFVVDQRTATSSNSQLMASRRDFMSSAAVAAAVLVLPNVAEAATDAKKSPAAAGFPSFQGVFSDPKHPKGYRIIVAKGSGSATMTLSDGPAKDGSPGKIFTFPVKVKQDKKAGTTLLTIDFSPKGGPKDVVGTLACDGNCLTFPDGNKWKKNTGVEGVYKDGKASNSLRVIRKDKGSNLVVELRSGSKDATILALKSGSNKKEGTYVNFDFPGKKSTDPADKVKGSVDNGIIAFPDGNKWTKL